MEEKKIIIDVTWKTAVSIWWKFFVINLFALFAVWLLWTMVVPVTTSTPLKKPTSYSEAIKQDANRERQKYKQYDECFAEKLRNNENVNDCNKYLPK